VRAVAAEGVLAFLRKPVERLRPNERYLQNTLNSVNYGERLFYSARSAHSRRG
jgi:hypothetical protein